MDFSIMHHSCDEYKTELAVIYGTLKNPQALKDFSIVQEFIYKLQKSHLNQEKEDTARGDLKKRYTLKIKTHTALAIVDALHSFRHKDHPYAKSRIYWIQEQITTQIL